MATEQQAPTASLIDVKIDPFTEILTIEGVKYSFALFRDLGFRPSDPDSFFQIVRRDDGVLTLQGTTRDGVLRGRIAALDLGPLDILTVQTEKALSDYAAERVIRTITDTLHAHGKTNAVMVFQQGMKPGAIRVVEPPSAGDTVATAIGRMREGP